jgi:hypothetical protein
VVLEAASKVVLEAFVSANPEATPATAAAPSMNPILTVTRREPTEDRENRVINYQKRTHQHVVSNNEKMLTTCR